MQEIGIEDIYELKKLGTDLIEMGKRLEEKAIELVRAKTYVMELQMQLDVIKDHKKDHEEIIRIKKLEINTKNNKG